MQSGRTSEVASGWGLLGDGSTMATESLEGSRGHKGIRREHRGQSWGGVDPQGPHHWAGVMEGDTLYPSDSKQPRRLQTQDADGVLRFFKDKSAISEKNSMKNPISSHDAHGC